ncbi:MAG: HAD hydrolase-like protein, partial [Actinomycetes bacterium]
SGTSSGTSSKSFMVGFDLDMTLVDSSDGITSTMDVVLKKHGYNIPLEEMAKTVGIPLWDSFGQWVPAELVDPLVHEYRALYAEIGIPQTTVLPGAQEALEAIRALGGRTMVVSAKLEAAVVKIVKYLDLELDVVVGDLYAEKKASALKAESAAIYVGDHPGDVRGAKSAGAVSVAVATGPISREVLALEGPDIILASLLEFPAWLKAWHEEWLQAPAK